MVPPIFILVTFYLKKLYKVIAFEVINPQCEGKHPVNTMLLYIT